MGSQVDLARVQNVPQPLVGTVCDGRVDDQHQTGFESSPQTTVSILTIDHLLGSSQHALLLSLWLRLLPCGHDRDGDCEHLRQSTRYCSKTQLYGGARRATTRLHFAQIKRPHGRVPVKVGKVCAPDADKAARHAAVQPTEALLFNNARDGVHGASVVWIISRIAQRIAGFGLDLDLQAGLDDVERVDEGVGYDGTG